MDELTSKMNLLTINGFKIVVRSVDTLKKMFALFNELNEEANLMFTEHGIKIQAMDTGHVALTTVRISKEYFESYDVNESFAVGMNLSTLVRVLSCIEGSACFEYSDDRPDEFVVCSEHEHFRLKTLGLESEVMEIPDMEYDVEIDADAGVLQKYLKNFASFGDTMKFFTDQDIVVMSTTGDIGTVEMKFHDQPRIVINGKLSATFSSRHLVTFTKAANISKTAILRFANDQPVFIKYEFGKDSYISFHLAPKISESDEEDEDE